MKESGGGGERSARVRLRKEPESPPTYSDFDLEGLMREKAEVSVKTANWGRGFGGWGRGENACVKREVGKCDEGRERPAGKIIGFCEREGPRKVWEGSRT